jgi:hypothetical protein
MKADKYQILVQGLIDQSWSDYFAGMTMTAEPGGVTRLSGEIADQSALHGLLNRIRDLNIRLVAVQRIDIDGKTPVECRYCRMKKPPLTQIDR